MNFERPADQSDSASSAADLIERLYAAALEPGRYDDLMVLWQDHVEGVLQSTFLDEAVDEDFTEPPLIHVRDKSRGLEKHFLRAFSILERLGRTTDDRRSIEALVEVDTRPSMLIDENGQIFAANEAARAIFGVAEGGRLSALDMDSDGAANIRNALETMADQDPFRLLAIARVSPAGEHDDGELVMALCRAQRPNGAPPIGLLSVADVTWSARVGGVLAQAFGLTDTECDIARSLAHGHSAKRIAHTRRRSIATVRTQIKTVLRKLDVRSQSELMRLSAALVQIDLRGENARRRDRPAEAPNLIIRPGDRRLEYATVGPDTGRPVLFLHGMLDGHGVTVLAQSLLEKRGLRLVAPVRPHFGGSEPDGGPRGAPLRFAEDVEALLDTLEIDSCPVVGHMAGSVYAFAAASRLPDRISAIVSVSGGVPIISRRQFALMTPRQRIVAYTARYTPSLLPLVVRAGIALLDNGGDHAFVRALYESAPVDYRVARRPEVFDVLSSGYRLTVAQGHRAFEIDSRQVTTDWSRYVQGSRQPVVLIHGRHDPVVRFVTVAEFAARHPGRIRLIAVEDEGQLLFYARPEIVLDILHAL